jgi:uncharacterized SAM-binding protein YcdF (DUF218 family)
MVRVWKINRFHWILGNDDQPWSINRPDRLNHLINLDRPMQPFRRKLGLITAGLLVLGGLWWGGRLLVAASGPPEVLWVLGGSIRREMAAVQWAAAHPQQRVLISGGSKPPCVKALFDRAGVKGDRVWLEQCAQSTFGNCYWSLPILQRWGTKRVILMTSGSHQWRAGAMARLILGSHGIWVDVVTVPETGVPANQENPLKTVLDVGRAGAWAIGSQWNSPQCQQVGHLEQVNIAAWCQRAFRCEYQAGLSKICARSSQGLPQPDRAPSATPQSPSTR